MKFVFGRFASIAYLWLFCWSLHVIKFYRRELLDSGDWLSIFLSVVMALAILTGVVGIVTSLKVTKRIKGLAWPIGLCMVLSITSFTYVICFRDRVLDNFTRAVQHLLPSFDIDNREDWDSVRDSYMQFGEGLNARFGEGVEDTVRRHYYRYVTGWGSDIVNLIGGSGILVSIVALGLTLCLVSNLKRLKAQEDADAAAQIVEVPTPQQYQNYAAELQQTIQPQYMVPPAMYPPVNGPAPYYNQQQPIYNQRIPTGGYQGYIQNPAPAAQQQATTVTVSFPAPDAAATTVAAAQPITITPAGPGTYAQAIPITIAPPAPIPVAPASPTPIAPIDPIAPPPAAPVTIRPAAPAANQV